MITLGCCLNMFATAADPIGREYLPKLAAIGLDYVELPLAQVMELSDARFEVLLGQLKQSGVPCECCNNLFPATLRLTGEEVSFPKIRVYLEQAVDRAARMGATILVFGSAGAKNRPEGFAEEQAWIQLVELLRLADEMVRPQGMTIVLEPLNRGESNLILNLSESSALMKQTDRKTVQLLVDYYHFQLEQDDLSLLQTFAQELQHVHFADPPQRVIPEQFDAGVREFLRTLVSIGYAGRISAEVFSKQPEEDLTRFVQLMRAYKAG